MMLRKSLAACALLAFAAGCMQQRPVTRPPVTTAPPAPSSPAAETPSGAAGTSPASGSGTEPAAPAPTNIQPAQMAQAAPRPPATPAPAAPAANEPAPRPSAPGGRAPTAAAAARGADKPAAATPAAGGASQPSQAAAAPVAPAQPALDLTSLEQRLRDTHAIGLFTKLSLKNQVDDLLAQFRAFHRGQTPPDLPQLRQHFELLLLKVVSLLQDGDAQLATAVSASRDAIWAVLVDPVKFAQI